MKSDEFKPYQKFVTGDWYEFTTAHGISGLARFRITKNQEPAIELLVINASKPRSGQFRSFLAEAQREFACIMIWAIMNKEFNGALLRYGFSPVWDEEREPGLAWVRGQRVFEGNSCGHTSPIAG